MLFISLLDEAPISFTISFTDVQDVPKDLVIQYYYLCCGSTVQNVPNDYTQSNLDENESHIIEYHEIKNADHYMLMNVETSSWAEISQIFFNAYKGCLET